MVRAWMGCYMTNHEKTNQTKKNTQNKNKILKNKKTNKKGVDYCASANRVCHARAQCINLQTTYACHCSPGYTGDGKHCSGTYLHNETKTKKNSSLIHTTRASGV
jgi:hypothetical protein